MGVMLVLPQTGHGRLSSMFVRPGRLRDADWLFGCLQLGQFLPKAFIRATSQHRDATSVSYAVSLASQGAGVPSKCRAYFLHVKAEKRNNKP